MKYPKSAIFPIDLPLIGFFPAPLASPLFAFAGILPFFCSISPLLDFASNPEDEPDP
jgi:hypothetical protein